MSFFTILFLCSFQKISFVKCVRAGVILDVVLFVSFICNYNVQLLFFINFQVFVPKHFESARQQSAIRCSMRANEGLLYPLAKSFIFIHKPTIVVKFEDVASVEFLRYDPASNSGELSNMHCSLSFLFLTLCFSFLYFSATRNFDLLVKLKTQSSFSNGSSVSEYVFSSIDRTEYQTLFDFLSTRRVEVLVPEVSNCMGVC